MVVKKAKGFQQPVFTVQVAGFGGRTKVKEGLKRFKVLSNSQRAYTYKYGLGLLQERKFK